MVITSKGDIKVEIQKVKVKYPAVLKLVFRKKGVLVNSDYAIIDMDSYNFVGVMADDRIYGKYFKDGHYEVTYYYNQFSITRHRIGKPNMYRIKFEFPFQQENFFYDFEKKLIKAFLEEAEYELLLIGIVTEKEIVERCLKTNAEFICS